jgi:D-glycero-alpha-D-manno-heptose-7-phosphate kinase
VHPVDPQLAEQACHIEIDRLKEPIGKQDQYIAAYGGVTCFTFHPDEHVDAEPLAIPMTSLHDLEDNLLLFFTGYSRSAGSILKVQDEKSRVSDKEMTDNLHFVKELGYQSQEALEVWPERAYPREFGRRSNPTSSAGFPPPTADGSTAPVGKHAPNCETSMIT